MTDLLLVMSKSCRAGRNRFPFVISHLPFEIEVRSIHSLDIIAAYKRKRRYGSPEMTNEKWKMEIELTTS